MTNSPLQIISIAIALAATACTGAPQYGYSPSELDGAITVADAPPPDALTPVLDDDAGVMGMIETRATGAVVAPRPVMVELPTQ